MSIARFPIDVARFARLLNRADPDIVHVHDDRSMLVAAAATRLRPVPALVRTYHSLTGARAAGRGRVGRAVLALGDKVAGFVARRSLDHGVAFTEAGCSDVLRRYGLRTDTVSAVPNGVDIERFKPLTANQARDRFREELGFGPTDVVFGTVGRLVTVKGHRILVDAFERVAREEPRVGLVLTGDGPLRDELGAAVHAASAAARIRLLGQRRTDAKLYGSLDVFVYPSVAGAYGLVVLEAMACGLPVVASRLQGTEELIADGDNGLLVSPADPGALATALLNLVRSAAERRRVGDQARRDAMQYSDTAMVERYEALYRMLLDRPDPRRPARGAGD